MCGLLYSWHSVLWDFFPLGIKVPICLEKKKFLIVVPALLALTIMGVLCAVWKWIWMIQRFIVVWPFHGKFLCLFLLSSVAAGALWEPNCIFCWWAITRHPFSNYCDGWEWSVPVNFRRKGLIGNFRNSCSCSGRLWQMSINRGFRTHETNSMTWWWSWWNHPDFTSTL